jgi:hypothetical protein
MYGIYSSLQQILASRYTGIGAAITMESNRSRNATQRGLSTNCGNTRMGL